MSQSGVYGSTAVPVTVVETLTGNTGGAVGPTGNNINIVGTGGISVAGNPGTSTLTISSGSSGIGTIDGNSSFVTGSTVTFTTGASNAQGTALFTGNGTTTMTMTFDTGTGNLGLGTVALSNNPGSGNTAIGTLAGQSVTSSGTLNSFFGYRAGRGVTSGNQNCFFGAFADGVNTGLTGDNNIGIGYQSSINLGAAHDNIAIGTNSLAITDGVYNCCIGSGSGGNYTGSESSNILLNNNGTLAESNVLRVGSGTGSGNQQLAKAFISGINGVNVGSVASVVSISGDQLGSTTITAGSGVTVTPGANTITISASGGGGGDYVLIQTQTATSQASLNFTTGITSTYNNYQLIIDNLVPATTATAFCVSLSTDGGATYITTNYNQGNTGLTALSLNFNDSTFNYGTISLYNLTSGNGYVTVTGSGVIVDLTVPEVVNTGGNDAYLTASTVVNALQLVNSDGSTFSGTFSLYGITI